MDNWQPITTAPKDGTEFLAWFQKLKLDDDDEMTNEVVGGAQAITSFSGGSWNDPEWLDAHDSYFMEDWCFAPEPRLWRPLPPDPVAADYVRSAAPLVSEPAAQRRRENESQAFDEWWTTSGQGAEPLHTLITENAARAAWQERATRAAAPAVQVDAPLPPMGQRLYRTEAEVNDELLQLLLPDLQPDDLRTDGGSVNMPKVRSLVADRRQRAAEQPETQQPNSFHQTSAYGVRTVHTTLPMALVPREPTPEMMTAVDDAYGDGGDFEDMWRAAIAAAPAAGNQSAREAFEAWFSDSGEYPLAVQRNGEGYYLMQAQSAWAAWDAAWRAYRAAHATGAAA